MCAAASRVGLFRSPTVRPPTCLTRTGQFGCCSRVYGATVVADFDITDDRVGDDRTVVVAVWVELEAWTSERLSQPLRRVVDLGARFICLDLLGVSRIDWAGLTPV